MKQLPIPYTETMVKSIIQGLKRMTRRIKGLGIVNVDPDNWLLQGIYTDNVCQFEYINQDSINAGKITTAKPQWNVGDQLWVKETYTVLDPEHCVGFNNRFVYKADATEASDEIRREYIKKGWPYKWKPGRFMPKAAARIWLEITDIRCERLQNISREDCIAEGILPLNMSAAQLAEQGQKYFDYSKPKQHFVEGLDPFWSFNSLWCSINGGDSWEANPWVFVYTFKIINHEN